MRGPHLISNLVSSTSTFWKRNIPSIGHFLGDTLHYPPPSNIQFPPIVRETHAGQVDFGMAINQLKQVFLAITNFMAQNDETYKMVNHNKYVVEMSLAFLVYHP